MMDKSLQIRDSTPQRRNKFRLVFDLALLWSFASAISIPLRFDNWPPAVFLTYPPRGPYILIGIVFACYLILNKCIRTSVFPTLWYRIRLGISLATVVLCIYSQGWNPLRQVISKPPVNNTSDCLSLISANTGGHPVEFADQLDGSDLPDIICLQESVIAHRQSIADRLPNYQLYYGSDDVSFNHNSGFVRSNVIGLLKSTFATDGAIVDSDLTGYRTFAVTAPLISQPKTSLTIVNVHTTKALVFHAGLGGFLLETPSKARRHVSERIAIEEWISNQPKNSPIVLAGDFNAPTKTVGARFHHFTDSHMAASNHALLTFPENFPVLGIDHVFGSAQIEFIKSQAAPNPHSDHCYRRVEMAVRWPRVADNY